MLDTAMRTKLTEMLQIKPFTEWLRGRDPSETFRYDLDSDCCIARYVRSAFENLHVSVTPEIVQVDGTLVPLPGKLNEIVKPSDSWVSRVSMGTVLARALAYAVALLFVGFLFFPHSALAVTKTASWAWPTVRTDGTALPLTQIGNAVVCDISVAAPGGSCATAGGGSGGTVVPCVVTIPPTTATASCQVNVTSGHSFQLLVFDNANPPDASGPSNTVIVPLSAPAAVTNFTIQ